MKKLFVVFGICLAAIGLSLMLLPILSEPTELEQAMQNVVRIKDPTGHCSGTIVGPHTLITAAHCVPRPSQKDMLMAMFLGIAPEEPQVAVEKTGEVVVLEYTAPATIDAAVFVGNLERPTYPVVDVLEGEVYTADQAMLCGYPLRSSVLRCTPAKRLQNAGFKALFEATILHGESGGAVFNMHGKLIGIIQGMTPEGYAYVGSTAGVIPLKEQEKP